MKIAERNKLVYIMQRQRHLGQCLSIIAAFVFLSSTFRVIWFSVIDGLFFLCVCVVCVCVGVFIEIFCKITATTTTYAT